MTLFAKQVSRSSGAAEVEGRQAGARGSPAFSPVHGRDIGEKGEFLGPKFIAPKYVKEGRKSMKNMKRHK